MISTAAKRPSWRHLWTLWFRRLRWITHPITIFVALQIVWLAIIIIWVVWFVGQQAEIAKMANRFGHEYFSDKVTVAFLIAGCVLLGVLLLGVIMLFVFGQRQSYVARQQRAFVSSVTHELKSPLASLQLAFETMQSRKLDEPTSLRLANMVQGDLDRLKRLIDQILVAGRLDRGILAFEEESHTVHVTELIGRICETLSYLDPDLAQRLKIECPPGLVLTASRSALTLILNNLIENAIKYSPKHAEIDVGADQTGSEVFLYVRDCGFGLDKKDLRRIFRMFHRSESAIKKAIPGTGLGLYIVKSAVRLLGGRIWVESPGKNLGSTFYVSLPVAAAKADTTEEAANHG